MKTYIKEELNNLIAEVETAINTYHNDGDISDEEYEQLNDARATLYITLDLLRDEH